MKKLLILLSLISISAFSQTTLRQVLNNGDANTRLPAAVTSTVSSTDTIIVFKSGAWKKTTPGAFSALVPGWFTTGNSGTTAANFLGTTDNRSLRIRTNNIEYLTVDSVGLIGIGQVTPTAKLHVVGTGSTVATYAIKTLNSGAVNLFSVTDAGQIEAGNINQSLHMGVNNGRFETPFIMYNTSYGWGAMDSIGYGSNTSGQQNTGIGWGALYANISGQNNTCVGSNSGYRTTSSGNSFFGRDAGANSRLGSNIAIGDNTYAAQNNNDSIAFGTNNIAIGITAMQNTIWASNNIAIGYNAQLNNRDGIYNVAIGQQALQLLKNGNYNFAAGYAAMYNTTSGSSNVAIGSNDALYSNTTGSSNCAYGTQTLFSNTSGASNIAIGTQALYNNINDDRSIAIGTSALYTSQGGGSGGSNTAIGYDALRNVTTGYYNTAIGAGSGYNNVGVALTTGIGNTFLGTNASAGGSGLTNATAIGYNTVVYASNNLILGNSSTKVGINTGTVTVTNSLWVNGDVKISDGTQGAGKVFTSDANGVGSWQLSGTFVNDSNSTAGDAATVNSATGFFVKDASGTTFTLTNSLITATSRIFCVLEDGITVTGNIVSVTDIYAGGCVITFYTAANGLAASPSANQRVSFLVTN